LISEILNMLAGQGGYGGTGSPPSAGRVWGGSSFRGKQSQQTRSPIARSACCATCRPTCPCRRSPPKCPCR
jgi:hypothetical protein